MRRIERGARRRGPLRSSQSLTSLRHRLSRAMVRSRCSAGRVGVLSQITHVDNDTEAAKEKAKRFLMETKVANATRVRLLNADGVEVFNWGPDH
jgi:hypothetical protein